MVRNVKKHQYFGWGMDAFKVLNIRKRRLGYVYPSAIGSLIINQ